MFEAQLLYGTSTVYSPWFPRSGDYFIGTLDVISLDGATLTLEVFTKNQEDSGDGVNADTSVSIRASAAGRASAEWGPDDSGGIKELVRYKMTASGTDTQWVLFRILDPVWFDAVKA
ncbi:MAG TPA: hypothetical protein ENJ50_07950 [Planctomycetaceae bacterium]|nr:hypothetical protein [Planctomycetaceae bacterium]